MSVVGPVTDDNPTDSGEGCGKDPPCGDKRCPKCPPDRPYCLYCYWMPDPDWKPPEPDPKAKGGGTKGKGVGAADAGAALGSASGGKGGVLQAGLDSPAGPPENIYFAGDAPVRTPPAGPAGGLSPQGPSIAPVASASGPIPYYASPDESPASGGGPRPKASVAPQDSLPSNPAMRTGSPVVKELNRLSEDIKIKLEVEHRLQVDLLIAEAKNSPLQDELRKVLLYVREERFAAQNEFARIQKQYGVSPAPSDIEIFRSEEDPVVLTVFSAMMEPVGRAFQAAEGIVFAGGEELAAGLLYAAESMGIVPDGSAAEAMRLAADDLRWAASQVGWGEDPGTRQEAISNIIGAVMKAAARIKGPIGPEEESAMRTLLEGFLREKDPLADIPGLTPDQRDRLRMLRGRRRDLLLIVFLLLLILGPKAGPKGGSAPRAPTSGEPSPPPKSVPPPSEPVPSPKPEATPQPTPSPEPGSVPRPGGRGQPAPKGPAEPPGGPREPGTATPPESQPGVGKTGGGKSSGGEGAKAVPDPVPKPAGVPAYDDVPVPRSSADYPPNGGYAPGGPVPGTLAEGTVFDRFGGEGGYDISSPDVPWWERSLPGGKCGYGRYRVVRPGGIGVKAGRAAPAFGQPGGGAQWTLPKSVEQMLADGDIVRVGDFDPCARPR